MIFLNFSLFCTRPASSSFAIFGCVHCSFPNAEVLDELSKLRKWAELHVADNSCFHFRRIKFNKFEYNGKLNPTFVEGLFDLPFSSIRVYIDEPITPRFVHVSSAVVARPDRPGLDSSKLPPAVRLNKELGFILTYKLKMPNFLLLSRHLVLVRGAASWSGESRGTKDWR